MPARHTRLRRPAMLLLRCFDATAGEGCFNMPPLAGWSRSVATEILRPAHAKNQSAKLFAESGRPRTKRRSAVNSRRVTDLETGRGAAVGQRRWRRRRPRVDPGRSRRAPQRVRCRRHRYRKAAWSLRGSCRMRCTTWLVHHAPPSRSGRRGHDLHRDPERVRWRMRHIGRRR